MAPGCRGSYVPQGIEESFRQIRDVQANRPVRMGVDVRVSVVPIDFDVGGSDYSGDTNTGRTNRFYLHPGMLGIEFTSMLEDVLRRDFGHHVVAHVQDPITGFGSLTDPVGTEAATAGPARGNRASFHRGRVPSTSHRDWIFRQPKSLA